MNEDTLQPKTEQLIVKINGRPDEGLGLSFPEIETQWSRGFRIKDTIKLQGRYEFMFVMERQIK